MSIHARLKLIEEDLDSYQVHVELTLVDTPLLMVKIKADHASDWFIVRSKLLKAGFQVQNNGATP